MSDQITAWLRTIVPAAWSSVIAALVTAGAPTWLTDSLGDVGPTLAVPMILGAVYAGLRALEPRMPAWLTRIVLGSNTPPVYSSAGDGK
ncbi:hypothetical protein ACH347_34990 [Saccharopolyspora sp. 5N102]|uniref:hypothetical protein n=1 Tax=Saccharopolyspora sp. 5N102 TaxID=3375155 RepID=UPI0037B6BD7D